MPSRTILPSGEYDNLVKDDHGLGKLFREQAELNPTAVAVVEGDHTLTYAELHAKSLRLASQLREETYALEEPTGILVNPGANDIVTQIAVIYAGGTCVTLDPALSDQQIESRLGKIGSRHILVDAANEARVATLRQIVVDDNVPTNEEPSAMYDNIIETTLDHRTHLIHTSGTTSEPKAVQISGRSILQVAYHAPFIPLDSTDSVAHVNNTSFDVSLFDIWAPLLRGARIVVLAKNVLLDPIVLAENLEHYQVTVMATTTALLNLAAITCPSAFSRLKICFIGGEAANPRTIKTVLESKPPKNLINAYGPTECCIFALAHKVVLEDTKQDSVSIGKPIGKTSIYILDDSLVPVRGEEAGELFIGGAGVSRGYLNHPEKTAKSFLEIGGLTPTGEPIRLYRTGDVVRRDKAGAIHYVGRRDHQVKIRGFRIELEAVESALLKTGHFHAATALRIESPQEGAGGVLVAYAVPNASMKDPLVGVAETLKILLPDYMVPRIELIDSLPLNTHDKVDRKKLTSLYLERWKARLAVTKAEGVGTTTLSRLQQLWVDVLASNISHCGPNDDFFLLGGTSLQAAVLIHQIRQNFSVEISSLTLYENTTLSALASVIDQSKGVGKSKAIKDESEIWIADSRLADRLIPPTDQPQDWRHITEGRVMLTGVTGFVGAFFLHQLLQLPEVQQVGCLVRASDTTMALLRIRQSLEKYNLWRESFLRKILPLPGNLEDENLGLGKDRFEELAEWASVVFHLGAHVNYTQPYSMHRPANTLGTLHMLRFLSAGRPKALHYVSSISCFGPTGFFTGTTRVQEDTILFPHLKALPYDHGYAQSQWVAEQMLWNSMDRGFPIAIYRPGFITGHSVTGVSNPDDFFSRLMVACLELGSYPMLPNQRKEFVTVDYVNSAILHMATNRNLGHAYHIVPKDRGASVDMNETFRLAACNGFPEFQELAYSEWIDALAASDNKTLKPLLPMLEEKIHKGLTRWELYEHMPVYETDNTDKALADYPGGLDCPVLDEKLMGKYLQNWNAVSMSSGRSSSVSESSSSEPESSLATPQSENSSVESVSDKKYQETTQVIVVKC